MTNFILFHCQILNWNGRRRRRRLTNTVTTKTSNNIILSSIGTTTMKRRSGSHEYSFIVITLIFNVILLFLTLPSNAIAPKYETAYACEGKTLAIECENGDLINLIRANYGRFSITICNDHGNTDWSVNCMSPKSLRVLHSKCAHKQNCSVLATTSMFGDPCPGTHKYLEAHYLCVSMASQQTSSTTVATTNRVIPPWQLTTSYPSIWSTSTARYTNPTTARIANNDINYSNNSNNNNNNKTTLKVVPVTATIKSKITSQVTTTSSRPTILQNEVTKSFVTKSSSLGNGKRENSTHSTPVGHKTASISSQAQSSTTSSTSQTTIEDTNNNNDIYSTQPPIYQSVNSVINSNNENVNNNNVFCSPTTSRNLFWNLTRVGEVNVQPCPGGATGIAKWRCVFERIIDSNQYENFLDSESSNGVDALQQQIENKIVKLKPIWQPQTPDLTQCRSLWLNSLEIRVNHRDSSLISIANDLSQVTSSKTLYGGDMLVTTKIIQTMSEKMTYDIETFPDQRQREAIVYELLLGVVKTGSNLLDLSQHLSWLDLSFEDQMRVATSLLTGLEDNAFLLADTIIRERNVVQKVKNILLSVRVLETRNIVGNEIFPDSNVEQWNVSDDRIELPRGALIENSDGGLVRIVFVAFDRLESILRPTNILLSDSFVNGNRNQKSNLSLQQQSSEMGQPILIKQRILNSKVISASLGKGRHIQLSQPIRLILKHLKTENVTNPSCVFWNYIDHAWSEDGCYVEQTNKTHTICTCNHLTNFAILMDIVDEKVSEIYKLIDDKLLILIYISIAICIVFILIAILTLKLFNGIFTKSNRTTIYKNLYICLLVIEILFLIGIELNETHVLCGFTSAFLHCSFLCAIAWIFCEGFQLYVMLTTDDMLLDGEKSSKIIWYYLFTYGLSFTIVAIALFINPNTYTRADYCVWMERNNIFYFTFLAPIIFFIMANLVYSTMTFYIMCKKYKTSLKNKEHTRLASVRFYLRCSIIFLVIFVSVWIFGYLYMESIKSNNNKNSNDSSSIIYGYLFVILNSFQGIYIFIFHFIQNDKVRNEYYKLLRRNKWLTKCFKCNSKNNNNSNKNNDSNIVGSSGVIINTTANNNVGSNTNNNTISTNILQSTTNPNNNYTINNTQISPTSSLSINSNNLIYNTSNSNSNNNNCDWNYLQQHPQQTHNTFNNRFTNTLNHKNKTKVGLIPGTLNHPSCVMPKQQLQSSNNYSRSIENLTNFNNKLVKEDDFINNYYWKNEQNTMNDNIGGVGNMLSYPSSSSTITPSPASFITMNNKKKSLYQLKQQPSKMQSKTIDGRHKIQTIPTQQTLEFDYNNYQRQIQHQPIIPSQYLYKMDYQTDGALISTAPVPSLSHHHLINNYNKNQQHLNLNHHHPIGSSSCSNSNLVNSYIEEPVYEEIVNSHHSNENDNDDDIDDDDVIGDDENEDEDDDLDDDEDDDLIDDNYRIRKIMNNFDSNKDNNKLRQSAKTANFGPGKGSSYSNQENQSQQNHHDRIHQEVQQLQQQQHIGRNLSAMLDENNTVICYLEPLPKH